MAVTPGPADSGSSQSPDSCLAPVPRRHEQQRPLVILGGTFDPVHNGHLQTALELSERLPGCDVCLLPAHQPPHRATPGVASYHRLQMAELATQGLPELFVDDRELLRDAPSYTVDTLAELRREQGGQRPLIFAMGMDAFNSIERWHQWPRLLELAHLIVCRRPGWQPPEQGAAAELLTSHGVVTASELCRRPAGLILPLTLSQLQISATYVRQRLADGQSCRYLLPAEVCSYIHQHYLYQ